MDQPAGQNFLRLFCAVELPADLRARAAAHAARLRATLEAPLKVSWEREEKLHLTLKFFGDVEPARAQPLADALARCAARFRPFELRLAGCGVFPSASRPNVLWLGVADDAGTLSALQRDLEDECARSGFERDARPFHPHVTLARLRVATGEARRLARRHTESDFEPATFPVTHLTLMRSQLGPGGSTYMAMSQAGLGDGSWGRD